MYRRQLGRRIGAELVGQPPAGVLVGGERLALPSARVQRPHELAAQPLAQADGPRSAPELQDGLAVPAEREPRLHVVLGGGDAQLLQASRLRRARTAPPGRRPAPVLARGPAPRAAALAARSVVAGVERAAGPPPRAARTGARPRSPDRRPAGSPRDAVRRRHRRRRGRVGAGHLSLQGVDRAGRRGRAVQHRRSAAPPPPSGPRRAAAARAGPQPRSADGRRASVSQPHLRRPQDAEPHVQLSIMIASTPRLPRIRRSMTPGTTWISRTQGGTNALASSRSPSRHESSRDGERIERPRPHGRGSRRAGFRRGGSEHGGAYGQHVRQVLGDREPALAVVVGSANTCRHGCRSRDPRCPVGVHRVAQHRGVTVLLRQPRRQRPPRRARVVAAEDPQRGRPGVRHTSA